MHPDEPTTAGRIIRFLSGLWRPAAGARPDRAGAAGPALREGLFAAAFEESEDAVLGLDAGGRVRFASRGAAELLAAPRAGIPGLTFQDLFAEPKEGAGILALARRVRVLRLQPATLARRDGSWARGLVSARAIGGGGGRAPAGFHVQLYPDASGPAGADGAEFVLKTMRPAQRFSAVGLMAAAFAHDMRTPLHVISSSAEYALEALSPGERVREALLAIARNAAHATESVRALLDFARAGKCQLRPGALAAVVSAAAALAEDAARKRGVRIERALGEAPDILLDPLHLQAAVYNVMMNGVEAMPGGGVLAVSTGRDGAGMAFLRVADSGAGMEPEVLAMASRAVFTTKEAGFGLGLYLTAAIAAEHGAQLSFESSKGKGTSVTMSFRPARPEETR